MPILEYNLPKYPCASDVWDTLKEEKRPIVVYGMGNGADKLFRRFEKYGISVADIFASDGFVRGQSFRGLKVKSFSEIKASYSDFVIVLSFASAKPDVVNMLCEIDKAYDVYIPDMPVANENEYFDREFYNNNYDAILNVYNNLSDNASKNTYAAVINYKLSGKMEYLMGGYSEKSEMYSLLSPDTVKNVIDAGAYNGDTAKEAIEYFKNLNLIYAFEPDKRNFKKLSQFAECSPIKINAYNFAVWSETCKGVFLESGNRNSTAVSTASYESKNNEVDFVSLDSLGVKNVDYIKYDVEGAEFEALRGSETIIAESAPKLLVSLYHRSSDVFLLVGHLMKKYPDYDFYVRRMFCIPAWELNLIMIPKPIE